MVTGSGGNSTEPALLQQPRIRQTRSTIHETHSPHATTQAPTLMVMATVGRITEPALLQLQGPTHKPAQTFPNATTQALIPMVTALGGNSTEPALLLQPKIRQIPVAARKTHSPLATTQALTLMVMAMVGRINRTCIVAASGASIETDITAGKQPADESAPKSPSVTPDGGIQPVVTRDENNPFSKFQLDNTLYTNNVYDVRQLDLGNRGNLIFHDGVQDFVRWEVPAPLGNDPNPCVRAQSADPVTLSYRLTSLINSPSTRNSFVRSFPAMVVGTMGGRFESWGVECGVTQPFLSGTQRHGRSPVFQMETVAAATGMPVLAADLDYDVRVSVKADLLEGNAANGVANVFMDSYWHDVSKPSVVPGASRNLVNTINGINSNFTEVWNLNIWFDYPRFEGNPSSWTGGFRIGSVSFREGGKFDVYFKIEGARDGHRPRCVIGGSDNCFLYIGLVAVDNNAARNGITVNYTEVAQWMRSAAFRDLFLVGASQKDTNAANAHEAWRLIDGTENDKNPDPAKRGPRFPDQNHVIGGIHLGAELWYNPNAVPASIVFETLGVEVEGKGQFGRYVRH